MVDSTEYYVRLYVTGGTEQGEAALSTLKRFCRTVTCRIRSEVIDVLLHPEMLLDLGTEPTPVLVRVKPDPVRVFTGRLTEPEQIAELLDR
jgi:hypothetical protein